MKKLFWTSCSWLALLLWSQGLSPACAGEEDGAADRNTIEHAAGSNLGKHTSQYHIGVEFIDVPPALRSHLKLEEAVALMVTEVAADSPAKLAGMQPFDVVVAVNGNPLQKAKDLFEQIQQGQELSLRIIRAGTEDTVKVTPAERPKENVIHSRGWPVDDEPHGRALRINSPGGLFNGVTISNKVLADGTTVSVKREGDQAAQVTVRRGDETWSMTETELDKLPADLSKLVESMMSQSQRPPILLPEVTGSTAKQLHVLTPSSESANDDLKTQLEEINRLLKQMQVDLKELREAQRAK